MGRRNHTAMRIAGGRERGVVLLIALIVLIAMTLAGIGVIRSVDTGGLVAGNIGYRQMAVATGDAGIEAARAWLLANSTTLDADNPSAGYYSTRQDNIDYTGNRTEGGLDGVNWGGSDPSQPVAAFSAGPLDATGAQVYYLINRLCSVPGSINLPTQSCAVAQTAASGSTQSAADYSSYGLALKNQPYFKITVRVNGPKNTVSYVQAIVLI